MNASLLVYTYCIYLIVPRRNSIPWPHPPAPLPLPANFHAIHEEAVSHRSLVPWVHVQIMNKCKDWRCSNRRESALNQWKVFFFSLLSLSALLWEKKFVIHAVKKKWLAGFVCTWGFCSETYQIFLFIYLFIYLLSNSNSRQAANYRKW